MLQSESPPGLDSNPHLTGEEWLIREIGAYLKDVCIFVDKLVRHE